MLRENNLGKYFTYAIGEIILVVIGILIALQINTANQNRQRAKLETVLLKQVKNEMLDIYEDIWRDAARLKKGDKSHYNISRYIGQNAAYSDSLCFDFYWLKMDEYIYPTNAAYSRIKKEGLDIVKNDTIRYYLQAIYEGVFPRLMKNNSFTPDISNFFRDYYLNSFKPNTDLSIKFKHKLANDTIGTRVYSNEEFKFPKVNNRNGNQHTVGYVPLNFDELKNDNKFHMLLEESKQFRNYKLSRYATGKLVIKEVVNLIDAELKK